MMGPRAARRRGKVNTPGASMKVVLDNGRTIPVPGRRTRRIIMWLLSRMDLVESESKLQVIANLAGGDFKPKLVIFDEGNDASAT